MTITLHLRPEVEAGLLAQAQANGITLEELLQRMVEDVVQAQHLSGSSEERAEAFENWSAGHRATTPLSDFAVSRDSLYHRNN